MISAQVSGRRQQGIHPRTRIGRVCLESIRVAELAAFYTRSLGLEELQRGEGSILLGAGHGVLLSLQEVPELRVQPRSAGLFHVALRVPDRLALARVVRRLLDTGASLEGSADHLVSEAVYLHDPEGNGIEVYRDRPRDSWFEEGRLRMGTLPLDVEELLAELRRAGVAAPTAAPLQTVVGHVHLRVSDLAGTERFYTQALGFDLTMRMGSRAGFVSAGGYHHHIGFNTWGGPFTPRSERAAGGLGYYTVLLPGPRELESTASRLERHGVILERQAGAFALRDPSGIRVLLETE
jgi:catechol 2,3-dioxygenase